MKYAALNKMILALAVIFTGALAASPFANASEPEASGAEPAEQHEEKFNASELIMGHIADSHEWHILGSHENPVSIPLPVILYDQATGFTFAMSNAFEHEHVVNNRYVMEHDKIKVVDASGEVDEAATAGLWDFSITKNVASILFSLTLMLLVFFQVAKAYKRNGVKAPRGIQSLLEPIIVFVRDEIAKSTIGEKKYERFMPFLLTVFFFIWINNLLGLIPIMPGGANVTGSITVCMALALMTFIITTIRGNKHYWRHIFAMPGVPVAVLPILTIIELLGVFLKPFVLMVRLFANITAGHIIALSFFSLIFIFGELNPIAGYGSSVLSLVFTVFMAMLELLVAFIQAYVFTLLSAIYFGMAVEEHHDHH
ncbi:MAG: F0F1 ATP synthase subunit A [Flavobacteriales bacterium]|nr:F0F1 ATP synthase subunit A [Flavobacteriales bacterium]